MRVQKVIAALVAATMFTGQLAMAQGDLNQGDWSRYNQGQRYDQRQSNEQWQRYERQDRRDFDYRQRNYYRQDQRRSYGDERRYERGAGPNHDFHRGARLPSHYRTRQYVVEDWRGHRLSPPPRGYHWVQTGSDYVLAAIATGIILQLLLNNN